MTCLSDFEAVREALRIGRRSAIVPLHQFIFENAGDRGNRQRLRTFKGFEFDEGDEQFTTKCTYISENLSSGDLTTICVLLGLDHNKEDLKRHIFRNLVAGKLLQDVSVEDNADEEDNNNDNDDGGGGDSAEGVSDDELSMKSLNLQGDRAEVGRQTDRAAGHCRDEHRPKFMLSFRDVEDSVRPFDGGTSIPVEVWLVEFEETAAMLGWDQTQMLIFAKKSLRGLAKLFAAGEKGLTTWAKLKSALTREFKLKVNSRQVHQTLTERTIRRDETVMEYLYKMREIANGASVSDSDLIHYVIDGIKDIRMNKQMLYGARSLEEFKEKVRDYETYMAKAAVTPREVGRVYERVRTPFKPSSSSGVPVNPFKTRSAEVRPERGDMRRCYNCGEMNHLARECRQQLKCFECKKLGHRASECRQNEKGQPAARDRDQHQTSVNMMLGNGPGNLIFKSIAMADHVVEALVDTGSTVSLVRNDVLLLMDDRITLRGEKLRLAGIGGSEITTLGSFEVEVRADGLSFPLEFHAVPEKGFPYSVILGRDVLNEVDLAVSKQRARFIRRQTSTNAVQRGSQPAEISARAVDRSETNDEWLTEWWEDKQTLCAAVEAERDPESEDPVDVPHLTGALAEEVQRLVKGYRPTKSRTAPVAMKLTLTDDIPIRQRPRRLPYADQREVDKIVAQWLEEGIVRPSTSEYSAPVVLVRKKDGSHRLCCDYRLINKKIVKDNFPMPLVEEAVEKLQGALVFTTLDLANGFFHVPIEESSVKYTSFVTQSGQYEFLFVPFGVTNSPAVFVRYIMAIFHDMIRSGLVMIYMDDIVIPTKDEDAGAHNLRLVLERAAEYGLNIRWKKCQMLQRRVDFLGYIIEDNTIRPSDEKTKAIRNFPPPKTSKSLQRFLGLTSYFRRFVEGYATLARPLSDLLRKNVEWRWDDEQSATFEQLKLALVRAPVLQIYNPCAETEIHTDASQYGYGAMLLQKLADDAQFHPVQYMSRRTKPAEEKYHSYELEVLAIIEALKKWRMYVLGIKIRIVTDCNAFNLTMQKKDVPLRVARWAMFLQEYDYEIEHRAGTRMRHVDALSRVACLLLEPTLSQRLAAAQLSDDWVRAIKKVLEKDEYEDFYLQGGVVFKDPNKQLIVVPDAMEAEIIGVAHRQGHYAVQKTQEIIEKQFFIPRLAKKVTKAIESCVECIMTNEKTGKREGFIFPIDKEDAPLATLHLDHVGPMDVTKKGYNCRAATLRRGISCRER